MTETLLELQRIHEATNWVLLGIGLLDFLGLLVATYGVYLTRGTKASVERVARMDERGEEEFRKLSYYLFAKLGPLDMR